MNIQSLVSIFILLVIITFYILNIREYGFREGARSRKTKYVTQEEILNRISGNSKAIGKLKKRLDSIGDIKKRLDTVESKTEDLPEN